MFLPYYRFIYFIKDLLINLLINMGHMLWAKDITVGRNSALSLEINALMEE